MEIKPKLKLYNIICIKTISWSLESGFRSLIMNCFYMSRTVPPGRPQFWACALRPWARRGRVSRDRAVSLHTARWGATYPCERHLGFCLPVLVSLLACLTRCPHGLVCVLTPAPRLCVSWDCTPLLWAHPSLSPILFWLHCGFKLHSPQIWLCEYSFSASPNLPNLWAPKGSASLMVLIMHLLADLAAAVEQWRRKPGARAPLSRWSKRLVQHQRQGEQNLGWASVTRAAQIHAHACVYVCHAAQLDRHKAGCILLFCVLVVVV